jgi:hypothetical protein
VDESEPGSANFWSCRGRVCRDPAERTFALCRAVAGRTVSWSRGRVLLRIEALDQDGKLGVAAGVARDRPGGTNQTF